MAFHRTIVARAGFVDEMIAYFEGRGSGLIGVAGQWLGPVADDEAHAIEEATEYLEVSSIRSGSVVAPDSVEAWEMTDSTGETVIGWSITADGWFAEDED